MAASTSLVAKIASPAVPSGLSLSSATLTSPTITFATMTWSNVPYVLAKSFVAVSGPADTNENTLATITLPAGAMGANGQVRLRAFFACTSSANNKTFFVRHSGTGGTAHVNSVQTTISRLCIDLIIGNVNAENSQYGGAMLLSSATGAMAPNTTAAVDTSAETTIVIRGQKASAGETLTLSGYICEVMYST